MYDRERLQRLMELDFSLLDAGLFLDTHPDDERALAYHAQVKQARDQARSAYVAMYGPLTQDEASQTDACIWHWIAEPWPWQMEE